jgi:hypothetical protein
MNRTRTPESVARNFDHRADRDLEISEHQHLKRKSAATAVKYRSVHTPKGPNNEPHGATRQEAIAKTPAK